MTESKEEQEIYYFAFASCPSMGGMLGIINHTSYKNWLTKQTKVIIHQPRSLRTVPDIRQPGIMNVMITAPVIVRTNQRVLPINADAIEIIAETEQDDEGNTFLKDGKDLTKNILQLFSDYQKALDNWKMDLSGLATPKNDIVLPDNVTPLNPNMDRPPK